MLWDISNLVSYLAMEIGFRMKKLLLIFLFLSTNVIATTNTLLDQKGSDIDLSSNLRTQKVLNLNDPFLIQLYTSWKAKGPIDIKSNDFFLNTVNHYYRTALVGLQDIKSKESDDLLKANELYLLYKLGHYQTFLGKWIDHSASTSFLKTELGLALDQVVAPHVSRIYLGTGFSLTKEMEKKLLKIEDIPNQINYSLQAIKYSKSGDKAVKWIGKLKKGDYFRVQLAYSAILSYAKQGKIGASGTLIKKIIEPWIEENNNKEDIAFYYLTLGRLLYQAKAFDESLAYYKLIPESSKYFLEARTESLWTHLQKRDFSNSAGELASLKMTVFSKQFYPEIFLASAIGHTMLCQFTDAKKSILGFIKSNKIWGKKIEEALKSKKPTLIRETATTRQMKNQIKNINKELDYFKRKKISGYDEDLHIRLSYVKILLNEEIRSQWSNRYKILDSALYKMKFVRIELLSRMKAVSEGLQNKLAGQDSVSLYQSANLKGNQMSFPDDGMPWGDELFNMSADVINQCIKGKFYVK
jgi:adenylate kinase family enzyme